MGRRVWRGFTDDNFYELLAGFPAIISFVVMVICLFNGSSNTGYWMLAAIFWTGFGLGISYRRPRYHCGPWCERCRERTKLTEGENAYKAGE